LGQLARLQSLNLSNNRLTALPESLGQVVQLPALDLANNQLTALPESLGRLARLESLDLYNNQLTALPESLGDLARLQSLDISRNQLTALPDSVGRLRQLHSLDLTGNSVSDLPPELRTLPLEEIDFDGLLELGIAKDVIRRSRARLAKIRLIRLQDFVAASAARDDERECKTRIPDGQSNCRSILDFYFARKE
jgi:Leucine-rich repeat (LRR) protein